MRYVLLVIPFVLAGCGDGRPVHYPTLAERMAVVSQMGQPQVVCRTTRTINVETTRCY